MTDTTTESGTRAEGRQGHDEGRREEHRVTGDRVISKLKELLDEGNVRHVVIKN